MLVKEKTVKEIDDSIGYYEAIYDSSNILQSTYFPNINRLYISFNHGGVYSYGDVDINLYEEFKNAESQGKYFIENIKKKPNKHPYRKEFTLYPEEVKDLKEERDINKDEKSIPKDDQSYMIYQNTDENAIIFRIDDEELIKLTSDGFYWKGNLVENDEEIYDDFKEWVNLALYDLRKV